MSYRQYKYEKELTDLQNKDSPDGSTCLISLYVPPKKAIPGFVQELKDEIGAEESLSTSKLLLALYEKYRNDLVFKLKGREILAIISLSKKSDLNFKLKIFSASCPEPFP